MLIQSVLFGLPLVTVKPVYVKYLVAVDIGFPEVNFPQILVNISTESSRLFINHQTDQRTNERTKQCQANELLSY